jgi:hypothetical protein
MVETGAVIIESPVGADIIVDGVKVGTVGAPMPETGKLSITTVPTGARVYTKRLGDYVYAGLTPQTLTLPVSPVPFLVKVTKPEYSDTHDMVYLVPNETVDRRYAMERVAITEPEEATTALNVMAHPAAELFLYMEGAEGFISYGRTPQTLTLKARTGAWVPMVEAKRALAETRLSPIENERVKTEDAKRTAMVEAAQEAYDTAKAERKDVEETLAGFRESYNSFQASFNVFFSGYTTFTTDYSSLQSNITSLGMEISQLEGMGSLDEWDREYLNDCQSALATLKSQLSQLEGTKDSLDAEKVNWDADNSYWTNILLEYEQRRTQCREYEQRMENELIEAKLKARAPFWLPTPGMKGVMWHLKLEEKGYRTEVDEFLLEPGVPMTKDYAIVRILDITTPESLSPLIINTPRPIPPDSPFAFAWLYIITWPEKTHFQWRVTDVKTNTTLCSGRGNCGYKFIQVKPGRRTYHFSGHTTYMKPVTMTLDIAPGETRYVQLDMVKLTVEEQAQAGAWLGTMDLKSWQPDVYKK